MTCSRRIFIANQFLFSFTASLGSDEDNFGNETNFFPSSPPKAIFSIIQYLYPVKRDKKLDCQNFIDERLDIKISLGFWRRWAWFCYKIRPPIGHFPRRARCHKCRRKIKPWMWSANHSSSGEWHERQILACLFCDTKSKCLSFVQKLPRHFRNRKAEKHIIS